MSLLFILNTSSPSNRETRQMTQMDPKQILRIVIGLASDGIIITGRDPETRYGLHAFK